MPDFKLLKSKKDKNDKKDNKNEKQGKARKISMSGAMKNPRRKMPVKTTINLANTEQSPVSLRRLAPVIGLIVLAVLILGKFFMFDRLVAASRAADEVYQLQTQMQAMYSQINSFNDIKDDYAHYTYSGMTQEELDLVDRVEVMKLIENVLYAGDNTKSWNLTGNVLTLQVTGTSLRELNELSRTLDKSEIVDQCILTTANKTDKIEQNIDVDATFIIYLKKAGSDTDTNKAANLQQAGEGENQ